MSSPCELEHGRITRYEVRVVRVRPEQVAFPCMYSLIELRRHSIQKKSGQEQRGRRVFLSTDDQISAQQAMEIIRERWGIENRNHHPRDHTMLEDKCRCRVGNSAANLAVLRGACLRLWRTQAKRECLPAFLQRHARRVDTILARIVKDQ